MKNWLESIANLPNISRTRFIAIIFISYWIYRLSIRTVDDRAKFMRGMLLLPIHSIEYHVSFWDYCLVRIRIMNRVKVIHLRFNIRVRHPSYVFTLFLMYTYAYYCCYLYFIIKILRSVVLWNSSIWILNRVVDNFQHLDWKTGWSNKQ